MGVGVLNMKKETKVKEKVEKKVEKKSENKAEKKGEERVLASTLSEDKRQWNRVYNFLKYHEFLGCFAENKTQEKKGSHHYYLTKKEAQNLLNALEIHLEKKSEKKYKFQAVREFMQSLKDFIQK